MGTRLFASAAAAAALVSGAGLLAHARNDAPSAPPAVSEARAVAAYDALPIRFEPNRGQGAANVRYLSRGPGYDLSLTPGGAILALTGSATGAKRPISASVRLGLIGADRGAQMSANSRLAGVSNYLAGPGRGDSQRGVPGFAQVRYHGVYPGIDLIFHGKRRRLEYDFVVAPGRDPDAIGLRFQGGRLSLSTDGDLLLTTPAGTLRQPRPVAYQRIGGARQRVSSRYELMGEGRVGFRLGAYDRSRPLVIDPELVYSGSPGETARGVAADAAGNAYLAGEAGRVTKLSPSGALVYSTRITGASFTDVAVGSDGRAFLTGNASAGFPATANAFSQAPTGAIVAVLDAQGSSLDYASTLPGAGSSGVLDQNGIAVDSADDAYITGSTPSDLLPVRAPGGVAFQVARSGGHHDAFVAKFDPSAAGDGSLVYATYLGGAGDDIAQRIAVDGAGSAYVTGQTRSQDFPTQDAYQSANAGGADAFVTKLNPQGSALEYSTYLGGTGDENERVPPFVLSSLTAMMHVAVDGSGNAYVSGNTPTGDFPTKNALQSASGGGPDGFVAKLDPSLAGGPSLVYSTYLGGSGADSAQGIAVDAQGGALVGGFTQSQELPIERPVARQGILGQALGRGDAFVGRIEPDGSGLSFLSYFGGGGDDAVNDLAVDSSGSAYLVGRSTSFDLPTADGLPSPTQFVAKIAPGDPGAPNVTGLSNYSAPSEGGTTIVISGSGFAGAGAVSFGGVAAQSFTVDSAEQITAVAPAHPIGPAPVVVTAGGKSSPPRNPIATVTYGVGHFAPTGPLVQARSGPAAALLRDGRALVAGGADAAGAPLASAELYDPATGTWAATGALNTASAAVTMTALPNGRALALGAGGPEQYNPVTGNWSSKPSLASHDARSSATVLEDGRVLVAGDARTDSRAGTSAELYDPEAGTWSLTGSMTTGRQGHGAALLTGPACAGPSRPSWCGKVLVAGGGSASAELYDPASGTWSPTGRLEIPRGAVDAVAMRDGRVLVAFGGAVEVDSLDPLFAETYDPADGTWSPADTPSVDRRGAAAALVPDGRVLFAGGSASRLGFFTAHRSAEVYDTTLPDGVPRLSTGMMTRYRGAPFAVALSSTTGCGSNCGKVLIGGDAGLAGRDTELYTPGRARAMTPLPPPPDPPTPPAPGEFLPPAAGVAPVARDTVVPSVSALSVGDRAFSIGSLLPRLVRASRVGTTIRFRLSEPATVRLSFARARAGRRVGRSCRAPSPRLRSRRSCTRYVTVRPAVVVRGARAGVNSVRFQGRLSRTRRLRPGRHELAVAATDAAGNRSASRKARFRLLQGRRQAR